MRLALHRSITFWAGIFVMISILWGWMDSRRFLSTARWRNFSLIHAGNGMIATKFKGPFAGGGIRREEAQAYPKMTEIQGEQMLAIHQEEGLELPFFPRPFLGNERSRFSVFIPQWLMLAVAGVVWLGLLVWRLKRRMPNEEFPNAA